MPLSLRDIIDGKDRDSYLLCFDTVTQQWKRLCAIDAKEQRESLSLVDPAGSQPPDSLVKSMCYEAAVSTKSDTREFPTVRDKVICVPPMPTGTPHPRPRVSGAKQLENLARKGHK